MGRRVKAYNRVAAPTTFFLAPIVPAAVNFAGTILLVLFSFFIGLSPIKVFLCGAAIHAALMAAHNTQPFFGRIIEAHIENALQALVHRTRNFRFVRK